MDIDLMNLQPTKISRDLKGKYILLYGQPKAGKTSFAVQAPNNLLAAFEMGYNALGGIMAQPLISWSDFKKLVKQLELAEAQQKYHTITIDTVTIAWDKCEEYICSRERKDSLADIPWGKGYAMCKKEFETQLRKITMLGYGLILIAHAEEKPVTMGSEETIIKPLLAKRAYDIVNGIVDIIGYISVEFDKEENASRYLYTRSTPNLFAGSRFKYLPTKLPFGYEELCTALAEAIEKSGGPNGEMLTNEPIVFKTVRDFSETMNEARNLWIELSKDEVKLNMAYDIVVKHFGQPIKLSEATEQQQEIVEAIIVDFKEIK